MCNIRSIALTILIAVFFMLIFCYCTYSRIPRYVKKEFKYTTLEAGIYEDRLNFVGSYADIENHTNIYPYPQRLCDKIFHSSNNDSSYRVNALVSYIIFFKNGICASMPHNNIINNQYIYENWGYYHIINDTLKIKLLNREPLLSGCVNAYEQWYRIINKNTIQPFYYRSITQSECTKLSGSVFYLDTLYYPQSKFYPLIKNSLINPNYNWLINKKWFWQNKEDYKKWKKSQKKN